MFYDPFISAQWRVDTDAKMNSQEFAPAGFEELLACKPGIVDLCSDKRDTGSEGSEGSEGCEGCRAPMSRRHTVDKDHDPFASLEDEDGFALSRIRQDIEALKL